MNKFYVYLFLDPRKPGKYVYNGIDYVFNFEPFYVGKGTGDRIKKHLTQYEIEWNYNPIKFGKLKHIKEAGFNPKDFTLIFKNNLEENDAFQLEIKLIKKIGRIDLGLGPLSNLTDGGEGATGVISSGKGKTYEERYGIEKAAEMRRARSERFKGEKNPMFGKASWCRGKKITGAALEKIREKAKQDWIPVKQMDDSGRTIKVWSCANEAATALGINCNTIRHVLNPKEHNLTGAGFCWEYVETPNQKYLNNSRIFFKLTSPENAVYYSNSMRKFCLDNGLNYGGFAQVLYSGRRKTDYKGWRANYISFEQYKKESGKII